MYNMKIFVFIIVYILFFLQSHSQGASNKMELKNIIKDEHSIRAFIDQNLEQMMVDKDALLDSNHSLAFEKFNKRLKQNNDSVSVYDIPINDIYAYTIADSSFALYLLIQIDIVKLERIIDYLGLPENLEDYNEIQTGNFSFLTWNFDSLSFWLDKDRFGNSKDRTTDKCILTITNIPISSLRD